MGIEDNNIDVNKLHTLEDINSFLDEHFEQDDKCLPISHIEKLYGILEDKQWGLNEVRETGRKLNSLLDMTIDNVARDIICMSLIESYRGLYFGTVHYYQLFSELFEMKTELESKINYE